MSARYFLSKGIKKGDVVMLALKRRYQFWYIVTALHKIGALCVPATDQLKQSDYEYRFACAGVKMIVSVDNGEDMDNIEAAERSAGPLIKAVVGKARPGWDDFDDEIAHFSPEFDKGDDFPCDDDLMLMYFTSGTTGKPKTVAHNYFYPLGHITTAYYWHGCVDNGLHFSVSDTGWAKCAWGKIYGQWFCGCAVMVYDMDRFDPEKLLDVMEAYPITSFCAPPTILRFLIRCDLSARKLSHIKSCTTAGEALNAEVYRIWYEKTGLKLREGFGQSESAIIAGTFKWMEPVPGALGKFNPLYRVLLVNAQGGPAVKGEEGQISILLNNGRSLGLFSCYYNDEEKTQETFKNNIYYTGDLAYMDEDDMLWHVGRADDVIKTSGYRVGPFEVESALMQHPGVLECAITGVPDKIRGQVIKASIVLNKGYTASDALAKDIQTFVKKITAPYKYPRVIEFLDALPKTASGKNQEI
jgi:acetyl-CoA synthetase